MHKGDDWEQHWSDYADSAAQNPAQEYRRKLISRYLDVAEHGARILDIGSGQGDLIASLHQEHPDSRLLGLELSESGVKIARQKVPYATFVQRDLLSDVEVPAEFQSWASYAVCSEVLEHVDDPAKLLWNARSFLQPGARLVVTVPGGPRSAFDRHIGHRRHYGIEDLRQLLDQAGFATEMVTGAGFPFFNLYRLTVIARGRRLIADVAAAEGKQAASPISRLVMRAFGRLFRFNLDRSSFGYQILAVCRAR